MKKRSAKKTAAFGAITDNPAAIVDVAVRELKTALREGDGLGVRQAANKGWLAAASVADVASRKICPHHPPTGTESRMYVLEQLEERARLRRGALTYPFGTAQAILHGGCFHEAVCPSAGQLFGHLDAIKEMAEEAQKALAKLPSPPKGRSCEPVRPKRHRVR